MQVLDSQSLPAKKNPATKGGVEVKAEGFLRVVISST